MRLLLGFVALFSAVGLGAGALALREDAPPPPWSGSWVATAEVAEVAVYLEPGGAGEPRARLKSPTASGATLVFLVDGRDAGGEWLPVHLPIRPNGSVGWVRAADVRLAPNDFLLAVDLSEREMTFSRRGRVEWTTPIGVGTRAMPTPPGRYYVKELLMPGKEDSLYGPFALGLSGFSDEPGASDFRGGDGVLAIHGTDDPDSIGDRVSHGCIRVPNDIITFLAGNLPMGTPVDIT